MLGWHCLHHAGTDGEPLALDQTGIHARTHHSLQYLAGDVAVAEATVPIDRERRMIRHLVVDIEGGQYRYGKGRELLANLNQYPCHDRIDPAQQMVGDAPFEVEQVK